MNVRRGGVPSVTVRDLSIPSTALRHPEIMMTRSRLQDVRYAELLAASDAVLICGFTGSRTQSVSKYHDRIAAQCVQQETDEIPTYKAEIFSRSNWFCIPKFGFANHKEVAVEQRYVLFLPSCGITLGHLVTLTVTIKGYRYGEHTLPHPKQICIRIFNRTGSTITAKVSPKVFPGVDPCYRARPGPSLEVT
ncbi:hypothetical protein J6590_019234 [Homalodisca vitripennis]|nr:hypothetical protein J6590_019234 [Homalodisca vitripennis]